MLPIAVLHLTVKLMKKYLQNDYQMHTAGVENLVQKINKGLPGILIFLHMWYVRSLTFICLMIHTFVLQEKISDVKNYREMLHN